MALKPAGKGPLREEDGPHQVQRAGPTHQPDEWTGTRGPQPPEGSVTFQPDDVLGDRPYSNGIAIPPMDVRVCDVVETAERAARRFVSGSMPIGEDPFRVINAHPRRINIVITNSGAQTVRISHDEQGTTGTRFGLLAGASIALPVASDIWAFCATGLSSRLDYLLTYLDG